MSGIGQFLGFVLALRVVRDAVVGCANFLSMAARVKARGSHSCGIPQAYNAHAVSVLTRCLW